MNQQDQTTQLIAPFDGIFCVLSYCYYFNSTLHLIKYIFLRSTVSSSSCLGLGAEFLVFFCKNPPSPSIISCKHAHPLSTVAREGSLLSLPDVCNISASYALPSCEQPVSHTSLPQQVSVDSGGLNNQNETVCVLRV